ncbi:MAG: alpha,alpha-trehalase TreA [Chitinophagaceae bacterium]
MKRNVFLLVAFIAALQLTAQKVQTPDLLWQKLFEEVQLKRIFPDNKTFVDMVPRYEPQVIINKYNALKSKDTAFDLKAFVAEHFSMPATPKVAVQQGLELQAHLHRLWDDLTRKADSAQAHGSLLPLPHAYIVPGGRFREIYYWDSYFTMLGLAESKRYDLIENMLNNFQWLIETYGHIPNGNRNYYLSRSQPPFFALMVDLLAQEKGDSVLKKYYSTIEKEYNWWMQGADALQPGQDSLHVVMLADGTVLNRYWDMKKAPREESYAEDVAIAHEYKNEDGMAYTHLRAGAESGWDFSSRWFADTLHLSTIETTNILPVDLNSLLYQYEALLSKTAASMGDKDKAAYYKQKADKRKAAIQKYFWNKKLNAFFDYHFKKGTTTDKWSAAIAMPLFTNVATKRQASDVQQHLQQKFLKEGGIVTTLYKTGQQWDAPNGWAPLQYVAVKGLMNYGYNSLARTIGERWMAVNEKVYKATGKMMEKYNVEDTGLEGGGGEYPTQDGFGWSNGVYLKFAQLFKPQSGKAGEKKAF